MLRYLEERVSTYVIKLKILRVIHPDIQVGPKPNVKCLYKRKTGGFQTPTYWKRDVETRQR